MGKLLWTEDGDHFNSTYPGCMPGVFHVLDYQNWHSNVKKILPHRKQARQHKANGYLIQVDQSSQKTIKDRLKAFVSQESLKKNDKKRGPMLQRTYSIHHLKTDEWVHFFSQNDNSEEFSEKEPEEDDTNKESEDYVDKSENSKIDKVIFPRIVEDGSRDSFTKSNLTKSGSFPSMLSSRKLRPTKLTHKLNEFYLGSKSEKGLDYWARNLNLSNMGSLMVELYKETGKNMKDDLTHDSIMSIRRICSFNEFTDGPCDDFYELPIEEEAVHQKTVETNELNLVVVPESSSQDESHQLEIPNSEGTLKPLCISEDSKNNIKSVNTHDHNDDCFVYIKEILERSGFMKNGFEQTWHYSNQPLNPLVFQQIEAQYPNDPECFEQEVIELSHHLHLFELVDETLLKMHERSFSYYPKTLSYSCHLSPIPNGKLVLEEVWKSVSRLMNLKPNKNQSLDSIVSWDFRDDDWMNLQRDSECIALELEDMIFEELLGEALCS